MGGGKSSQTLFNSTICLTYFLLMDIWHITPFLFLSLFARRNWLSHSESPKPRFSSALHQAVYKPQGKSQSALANYQQNQRTREIMCQLKKKEKNQLSSFFIHWFFRSLVVGAPHQKIRISRKCCFSLRWTLQPHGWLVCLVHRPHF